MCYRFWFASACGMALLAGATSPAAVPSAATPAQTLTQGHTGRVNTVAYSPDGRWLASGSMSEKDGQGVVKLWDLKAGNARTTPLAQMDHVEAVAFSPDGKKVAIGGGVLYQGNLALCDVETAKVIWVRSDVATTCGVRLAFSPDGKTIASTGDGGSSQPPRVLLCDAKTGKVRHELKGHRERAGPVAFSPDGKTLASGGDGEVILWDTASGKQQRKLDRVGKEKAEGVEVTAVTFAPDGKTFATATRGGTVRLWATKTGQHIRDYATGAGVPWSLDFTRDGKLLAGINRVWDAHTGKVQIDSTTKDGKGVAVAFSPDGKLLAVGCEDGSVRFTAMSK